MSDQIIVGAEVSSLGAASANTGQPQRLLPLEPIRAGVLNVGYFQIGAKDRLPVLLLRGWPYNIHSYVDVAPLFAVARGAPLLYSVRNQARYSRTSSELISSIGLSLIRSAHTSRTLSAFQGGGRETFPRFVL